MSRPYLSLQLIYVPILGDGNSVLQPLGVLLSPCLHLGTPENLSGTGGTLLLQTGQQSSCGSLLPGLLLQDKVLILNLNIPQQRTHPLLNQECLGSELPGHLVPPGGAARHRWRRRPPPLLPLRPAHRPQATHLVLALWLLQVLPN